MEYPDKEYGDEQRKHKDIGITAQNTKATIPAHGVLRDLRMRMISAVERAYMIKFFMQWTFYMRTD